jgi:hypothetical protein
MAALIEEAKRSGHAAILFKAVGGLESGLEALFGSLYGLMAVLQGIQLHESRKFLQQFGKGHTHALSDIQQDIDQLCLELKKYIHFLEGKLSIKTCVSTLDGSRIDSIEKKLQDKWSKKISLSLDPKEREKKIKEEVEKEFYQTAFDDAVKGLQHLIRAVELPKQSAEKCKQAVNRLFTREELVQRGRQLKRVRVLEKKEKKLVKFLSRAQIDLLKNKEKTPLSQRLFSKETQERTDAINQAKSLVNEVKKNSKESVALHAILLTCGILGFAATFLFPPLGIASSISAGIVLVICLVMMILDIRTFCMSLKNDQLEKYDERILLASSVLCTLAIVTALILTFAFSFGTTSLLLLTIGALWLGVNGYTFYRLKKNQREKEMLSPSLKIFQNVLLSKDATPEKVKKTFSLLSAHDQNMIKLFIWKKYADPHGGRLVQDIDLWLDRKGDFGGEFFLRNPLHEEVKEAVALNVKKFEEEQQRLKEEEKIQKEKLKSSLLLFFRSF